MSLKGCSLYHPTSRRLFYNDRRRRLLDPNPHRTRLLVVLEAHLEAHPARRGDDAVTVRTDLLGRLGHRARPRTRKNRIDATVIMAIRR
jgi:hypothetical protein